MDSEVSIHPYDNVWHTQHQGPIQVKDMKRSHIRNSLQWCIRKQEIHGPNIHKDGLYYNEWIAIFTARLLDPELGE